MGFHATDRTRAYDRLRSHIRGWSRNLPHDAAIIEEGADGRGQRGSPPGGYPHGSLFHADGARGARLRSRAEHGSAANARQRRSIPASHTTANQRVASRRDRNVTDLIALVGTSIAEDELASVHQAGFG